MDLNPVPLTPDPNACQIACHSWTSTLSNFITTLGWHPLHFFFVLPKNECCLPSLGHLHWAKLYHGRTFVGNPVGVFINPSQNTDFLNQVLGGMHRGERARDFLRGVSDQPIHLCISAIATWPLHWKYELLVIVISNGKIVSFDFSVVVFFWWHPLTQMSLCFIPSTNIYWAICKALRIYGPMKDWEIATDWRRQNN